jgi:hypothetical protein
MLQQGSELQKRLVGNAHSYHHTDRNPAAGHDLRLFDSRTAVVVFSAAL